MVCTATIAVVTAATDGGLLSPLSDCAMSGASAQNGINHMSMSDTPIRRRNGDRSVDSVSLVVDARLRILISQLYRRALGSCCPAYPDQVCHVHRDHQLWLMKASFRADLFGERRATLTHSQPASLEPLKSRSIRYPAGCVRRPRDQHRHWVIGESSQVSAPATT